MKRITLAALLASVAAAPALAGGLGELEAAPIIAAPPPAPVPASADWSGFYAGGQVGYGDVGNDVDGYGWLGGVHAGYNWDLGNYVVGTELDFDTTDIELGGGPDGIDSVARLKLKGGVEFGQSLLYATAGAAHAEASVGGVGLSDNGWFAGVGMGYQLTPQWVVGGEILGHKFDDFDGTGVDVDATTATLRASFRF